MAEASLLVDPLLPSDGIFTGSASFSPAPRSSLGSCYGVEGRLIQEHKIEAVSPSPSLVNQLLLLSNQENVNKKAMIQAAKQVLQAFKREDHKKSSMTWEVVHLVVSLKDEELFEGLALCLMKVIKEQSPLHQAWYHGLAYLVAHDKEAKLLTQETLHALFCFLSKRFLEFSIPTKQKKPSVLKGMLALADAMALIGKDRFSQDFRSSQQEPVDQKESDEEIGFHSRMRFQKAYLEKALAQIGQGLEMSVEVKPIEGRVRALFLGGVGLGLWGWKEKLSTPQQRVYRLQKALKEEGKEWYEKLRIVRMTFSSAWEDEATMSALLDWVQEGKKSRFWKKEDWLFVCGVVEILREYGLKEKGSKVCQKRAVELLDSFYRDKDGKWCGKNLDVAESALRALVRICRQRDDVIAQEAAYKLNRLEQDFRDAKKQRRSLTSAAHLFHKVMTHPRDWRTQTGFFSLPLFRLGGANILFVSIEQGLLPSNFLPEEEKQEKALAKKGEWPEAFVLRHEEIDLLREFLPEVPQDEVILTALVGKMGQGKSCLAKDFAYQFQECYRYVFFVDAQQDLVEQYRKIARSMELVLDETAPEEVGNRVVEALSQTDLWLLVVENAKEWRSLQKYLPDLRAFNPGTRHILLTSREEDAQWDRKIQLCSMQEAQAHQFFHQMGVQISQADLSMLFQKLPRLPLALRLIAGYLRIHQDSVEVPTYIEQVQVLQKEISSYLSSEKKGQVEEVLVRAIAELSLHELKKRDPQAFRLFQLLAYLAPVGVPQIILEKWAKHAQEHSYAACWHTLKKYALLHEDPETGTGFLHPTVQALVREKVDSSPREKPKPRRFTLGKPSAPQAQEPINAEKLWLEEEVLAVLSQAVRAIGQGDDLEVFLPHFEWVVAHAQRVGIKTIKEVLVPFHGALGMWYYSQGCGGRMLPILNAHYGEDSLDLGLAETLNQLGAFCVEKNLLEEGRVYLERAQKIHQHPQVGSDAFSVAALCINLGVLEQSENKNGRAKKYYEQALKIYTDQYGKNATELDLAVAYMRLGILKRNTGDWEGALPDIEQACLIYENYYGRESIYPDLGRAYNARATVRHHTQKDLIGAEEDLRQALQILESPQEGVSSEDLRSIYRNFALLRQDQAREERDPDQVEELQAEAKGFLKKVQEMEDSTINAHRRSNAERE